MEQFGKLFLCQIHFCTEMLDLFSCFDMIHRGSPFHDDPVIFDDLIIHDAYRFVNPRSVELQYERFRTAAARFRMSASSEGSATVSAVFILESEVRMFLCTLAKTSHLRCFIEQCDCLHIKEIVKILCILKNRTAFFRYNDLSGSIAPSHNTGCIHDSDAIPTKFHNSPSVIPHCSHTPSILVQYNKAIETNRISTDMKG